MLPLAMLAGGLGTRLGTLAQTTPKVLVEVHGRPFIAHQLDLLHSQGIEQVVLCVGHMGEQVRSAVGSGEEFGLRVSYSFDGARPLGTGGALKHALPELGEAFFVLYGDAYLDVDYSAVQQAFERSGRLGLMTVFRNQGRWDKSNVLLRDGRIACYNKRSPSTSMQHIDYGLGVLRATAFDDVPAGQPQDLAAIYERLVERDQLAAWEVTKRFYEIGSPAGLAETRAYLAARG